MTHESSRHHRDLFMTVERIGRSGCARGRRRSGGRSLDRFTARTRRRRRRRVGSVGWDRRHVELRVCLFDRWRRYDSGVLARGLSSQRLVISVYVHHGRSQSGTWWQEAGRSTDALRNVGRCDRMSDEGAADSITRCGPEGVRMSRGIRRQGEVSGERQLEGVGDG